MSNDIVAAVARHARVTPDAPALDCDGEIVTFAQLDRWSAALAVRLAESGVQPGEPVAIRSRDHNEHVAAVLATWRVGAWYFVVRDSLPAERVSQMLTSTGARWALVSPGLTPLGQGVEPVALERVEAEDGPDLRCDDLPAYACFTSGSTGRPKGVVVPHTAIRSFVAMVADVLDLGAERFFSGAEDEWDGSFVGTWSPLLVGGCSVTTRDRVNPEAMVDHIARTSTTRAFFTTALGEIVLRAEVPESVRDVVVGGDALRTRPAPDARFRLWNIYGPTEGVVVCTGGIVGPHDEPITIGRSLPGSHVEVVDDELVRVPDGVVGQLTIEGRLAYGYLGEPRLTAAAFVPATGGRRRYLTGDRARVLPSGDLEFLGRRDRQVSVRGRRVELDGVTAVIRAVAGTDAVRVCVLGDAGSVRLVAFVEGVGVTGAQVRDALTAHLPAAEMPDQVVVVDRLPTGDDEAALAAAVPDDGPPEELDEVDEVDDVILTTWAERVGGRRPSLDADFFASGGTSLTAIYIIQELQEAFEVTLGVAAFLRAPTPRTLAGLLRDALLDQLDSLTEEERQALTADER